MGSKSTRLSLVEPIRSTGSNNTSNNKRIIKFRRDLIVEDVHDNWSSSSSRRYPTMMTKRKPLTGKLIIKKSKHVFRGLAKLKKKTF